MKFQKQRYQAGSVRKVPRSKGFAWEFRYYHTAQDGKRRLKVQTFDSSVYKTERDVRKAVEGQLAALNSNTLAGRSGVTLGKVIDRYLAEDFTELKHSTQSTNKSLLELHIRPKWGDYRLADIRPLDVKVWLQTKNFGPGSKVRARNIISKLLDLAMLWEYMPVARNPMELVKVKGATKRTKQIVILSPADFRDLVKALPEPYNIMVLACGCLGLRVSEVLALKWSDLDRRALTVDIKRAFTHGRIQESSKTVSSQGALPVFPALMEALLNWEAKQQDHDFVYIFASPKTGTPYSDSTILTRYLKPAAEKLGIKGFGWHSLRHSYKSWMANVKISPAIMKDLMRHSDISTTMDVYGHTMTPELREANSLVAELLF